MLLHKEVLTGLTSNRRSIKVHCKKRAKNSMSEKNKMLTAQLYTKYVLKLLEEIEEME
jgi:hypothetical protein